MMWWSCFLPKKHYMVVGGWEVIIMKMLLGVGLWLINEESVLRLQWYRVSEFRSQSLHQEDHNHRTTCESSSGSEMSGLLWHWHSCDTHIHIRKRQRVKEKERKRQSEAETYRDRDRETRMRERKKDQGRKTRKEETMKHIKITNLIDLPRDCMNGKQLQSWSTKNSLLVMVLTNCAGKFEDADFVSHHLLLERIFWQCSSYK